MVGTKKLPVCCVSWVFRVYSLWYSYYPRVSIGFPLPLLSLTFSGFRAKTPPAHLSIWEIEPCYIRYQSPRDRRSTDYQPVSRRKKGDLLCQHRSLNALPPLTTIRYSSSTCFTPLWRPPPNRRACIGIRVAIPTARCASVSVSWQVVLPA